MSDPQPLDAKTLALATAQVIATQVRPIMEALAKDNEGEVVKALTPRPDDYQKVFVPDAVETARAGYTAARAGRLDLDYPSSEQSELRIYVAPAGMLGHDNELSRHFPGGYRAIAHLLNPHRVWAAWKYVRPSTGSGLAYDGLVFVDDHWVWFPKPYRVLGGQRIH